MKINKYCKLCYARPAISVDTKKDTIEWNKLYDHYQEHLKHIDNERDSHITSEQFDAHLKRVSKQVSKWPKWKRDLLK